MNPSARMRRPPLRPIVVELTRFRVAPERVGELLAARPAMLDAFAADRAGFISAELVRLLDNEWLDIVLWRSTTDLAASRAKGANLPGVSAFFDAIDAVLAAEQGELIGRPTPNGGAGRRARTEAS